MPKQAIDFVTVHERREHGRDLQHQVLRHLKEHGPTRWNALYVSFDRERTGTIGPVLQDLKRDKYIAVGPTDRVKITARGLEQLKRAG